MQLRTLSAPVLSLALVTSASAQSFDRTVVLTNLDAPTGITTGGGQADLYFTEVPQPGVAMSSNEVSLKSGASGQISQIAQGEPEPVNITMDPTTGDIYWACRSAGVIIRRSQGSNSVFLNNLNQPSGISAPGNGKLYITQLPTPGVPGSMGGSNTVDEIDLTTLAITNISTGEPEPFDIVADASGNAYWTCKSAGVILEYDASTGTKSMLLNGLEEPSGIDMDDAGRIYFTEVPNPGVAGMNNRVWQYEPSIANLTLISVGEPEPLDITATADGSTVYWTCRSAGVILRANRIGTQPTTTSASTFGIGETVNFAFDAGASAANMMYMAASAASIGPIMAGTRNWALAADGVFQNTFGNAGSSFANGYVGMLDASGQGAASLVLPNLPAIQGVKVFTSVLVIDPSALFTIDSFGSTHRFEIQ